MAEEQTREIQVASPDLPEDDIEVDVEDDDEFKDLPPEIPPRPRRASSRRLEPQRQAPPRPPSSNLSESTLPNDFSTMDSSFRRMESLNVLTTAGTDKIGRPLIVFYACNMPPRTELDHDDILAFMKHAFDGVVENDYSIVYFHHGLTSQNKPSFGWLRRAYKSFDRKYKKNLKALYVVHASTFVKAVMTVLRPLISSKFGKKVQFINRLNELGEHIHLDQLALPSIISAHDASLNERARRRTTTSQPSVTAAVAPKTVFGARLEAIERVESKSQVPILLLMAIKRVRQTALDAEGIFRRSSNAVEVRKIKEMINGGEPMDFADYPDVHLPAVIIKSFFRDLAEPVFTFRAYNSIISAAVLPDDDETKAPQIKSILESLPERHFNTIRTLFLFLAEVAEHESENKMGASNLSIVMGPNLIWSEESIASLSAMTQINRFTQYLITNVDVFFPSA